MTESSQPRIYYVAFCETRYPSLEEAKATAPDLIAAHLARSQELHVNGTLFMAGAFLDTGEGPLSTMGICTTYQAAEEYMKGDPFVLNGMVNHWYIRKWANLLV